MLRRAVSATHVFYFADVRETEDKKTDYIPSKVPYLPRRNKQGVHPWLYPQILKVCKL